MEQTWRFWWKLSEGGPETLKDFKKKPEFQLSLWGRKLPKGGMDEIQAVKQNNYVFTLRRPTSLKQSSLCHLRILFSLKKREFMI